MQTGTDAEYLENLSRTLLETERERDTLRQELQNARNKIARLELELNRQSSGSDQFSRYLDIARRFG